jgi:type VI secretion system protein ImpH
MAGETGPAPDPVAQLAALRERPYAFDFFEAMRRVECAWPSMPRLGTAARPADEPVRLGQKPSLDFPPSMLAEVDEIAEGRLKILGYFLGLYGPHGPLPLHLTEYVHDRITNARDSTLAGFTDIFHHRMLELFYRAWANARPTVHFDRPGEDRFASSYVAALLGLASPALRNRDAFPDRAKLFFSGLLSGGTKTCGGLESLLREYLGLPLHIEECVGEWLPVEPAEYLQLGSANAKLGGCVLGERVWSTQHKFRVVVGPVEVGSLLQYLPGSPSLARLRDAVLNYVGYEYAWDIKFIVHRTRVPGMKLGQFGHLGWTTWAAPGTQGMDVGDVIIDACRDAGLPAH